MDEKKQYSAYSIPRREEPSPKRTPNARPAPNALDFSTDVPFAEIEYELPTPSKPAFAPAQPILSRAADPLREKFFAMRSLSSGAPFARSDAKLFFKQAKFMADFTDNYSGSASFFLYAPCYQHMGYGQLRTYFTWRAQAREGQFPPIPISYVLLYIYELLSGIGVQTPRDGLERLLAVWQAYRSQEQSLDSYIPGWIKDYHIYYPLHDSFEAFVRAHQLQYYYQDALALDADAENSFALWSRLSAYDVHKSTYVKAGNEAVMQACFTEVYRAVEALCIASGRTLASLMVDRMHGKMLWTPFQRAVFYPWLAQTDRKLQMPGQEHYACKANRWTVKLPILNPDRRDLIGYLMKKTEACLRQHTKYKYKITANPASFPGLSRCLRRIELPIAALDAAIEKAVAAYLAKQSRTVVRVDPGNLNRIRREALKTQDKLIVPEDQAPILLNREPEPPAPPPAPLPPDSDEAGWAALLATLTATERGALAILLRDPEAIKPFADENGVMLEVLVDQLNEKAADFIGDSLIDSSDDMAVYEDYREILIEMMG